MAIKQVTVFKDSLGHLHETELEAVKAEAELKITQFFGASHIDTRQVRAMVHNAEGIIRALKPVADLLAPKQENQQ